MLQINYFYSADADIVFDDLFKYEITGSLDRIVNFIEWAMSEYSFTKAVAFNATTGEVLVQIIDGDDNYDLCNDDDLFDDGLACTE